MWKLFENVVDRALGLTRVRLTENQRAIVLRDGRFQDVLGPGEHRMPARGLEVQTHDITAPVVSSTYAAALERERPDLFARHVTVLEPEEGVVMALLRKGVLVALARSMRERGLYWTDAGPWEVRRMEVAGSLAIPDWLRPQIVAGGWSAVAHKATVEAGRTGLLFLDGDFAGELGPGVHLFWNLGRTVEVKVMDGRWRAYEVTGQEILTADRVTLRVNLMAEFRVTDPVVAATKVKSFDEALHRALPFAFRKALGARKLDEILARKESIDAEVADKVRREMAEIGLEVGDCAERRDPARRDA